jgi:3-oxoadipate enol-lactonase
VTMQKIDRVFQGQDGPHLVFLHGIGGNNTNFLPLMDCLPDYCCHAINLPGYGKSTVLSDGLTFPLLSDWLAAFLSSVSDHPVHLIGHSIGGMLGLEHALTHPTQVASLTMIGATSAFGGRDDQFKTEFLKQRLEPLDQGKTMADMAKMSVPSLLGSQASTKIKMAAINSMAQISEQQWRNILSCLVHFNRRADIAKLMMPVCVIAGAEDTNAPAATLEKMAATCQSADFHSIESVGHLLPLEAPLAIAAILKKFIGNQKST